MNEILSRPSRSTTRKKRLATIVAVGVINLGTSSCAMTLDSPVRNEAPSIDYEKDTVHVTTDQVLRSLGSLAIGNRAPKTGYTRERFGNGWLEKNGCDTRNLILKRDLANIALNAVTCEVLSGELTDPYSGSLILFRRGKTTSDRVQIDHVVSLSNAWQMSDQPFRASTEAAAEERVMFANDPLNLRAVDGKMNNAKSDSDIATWQPPKKSFRCEFASQQIIIKDKYDIKVTQAEHDVFLQILNTCPDQEFSIPN